MSTAGLFFFLSFFFLVGRGGGRWRGGPHRHSPLLIAVIYPLLSPILGAGTTQGSRLPACYATWLRLGSLTHLLLYRPFKSSLYRYYYYYYCFLFLLLKSFRSYAAKFGLYLLRLLRSSPPACLAKTELSLFRPSPTKQPVYYKLCRKTCACFQNLHFLLFLLAQTVVAGWLAAQIPSEEEPADHKKCLLSAIRVEFKNHFHADAYLPTALVLLLVAQQACGIFVHAAFFSFAVCHLWANDLHYNH